MARWLVNPRAELAQRAKVRELAAASLPELSLSPICFATGAQKQHILRLLQQLHISRAQRTRVLVGINRLTRAGAIVLRRQWSFPPGLAEVLDRRVAARFYPSSSLTYADLVRC